MTRVDSSLLLKIGRSPLLTAECCTDIVIGYGISWHFLLLIADNFVFLGRYYQAFWHRKMKITLNYSGQDSYHRQLHHSTNFTTWIKHLYLGGRGKKLFVTFLLTYHHPSDFKQKETYLLKKLNMAGFESASSYSKNHCIYVVAETFVIDHKEKSACLITTTRNFVIN